MGWWHMISMVLGLLLLTAASAFDRNPDYPETDICGNVSIPYPFGIKEICSRQGFDISCNKTDYNQTKPFRGKYEVLEITLQGQIRVTSHFASVCYNDSGRSFRFISSKSLRPKGPLTFSSTQIKFTAIGCDTIGYITGNNGQDFTSGCMSFCWNNESVTDGICFGIGCRQTSIPPGAKSFRVEVDSYNNHSDVVDFDPCSYAFLIADDQFRFNKSDLSVGSQYGRYQGIAKEEPLVPDWAIVNETCQQAIENLTTFACKSLNSFCSDFINGPAYRCNCTDGYDGNPYLEKGCKGTVISSCSLPG